MKILLIVCAALISFGTSASDCDGAVRGKGGLVKVGDTEGRIIKALGQPDRYRPVENKFGAHIAEEWIWYDTGFNPRTIRVIVAGTKAALVCESKD